MGPGFAELLLGRNRSRGQTVPHSGNSLHPNFGFGAKTEASDAHGRPERGCQARPGSEGGAGPVSVKRPQEPAPKRFRKPGTSIEVKSRSRGAAVPYNE